MKITKKDARFLIGVLPALLITPLIFVIRPFSIEASAWVAGCALWMIGTGGWPKLGNLSIRARMVALVCIALLVAAASAFAITMNADGSVTLTNEERENIIANVRQIEAERDSAEHTARALQKKLDALANSKCI